MQDCSSQIILEVILTPLLLLFTFFFPVLSLGVNRQLYLFTFLLHMRECLSCIVYMGASGFFLSLFP